MMPSTSPPLASPPALPAACPLLPADLPARFRQLGSLFIAVGTLLPLYTQVERFGGSFLQASLVVASWLGALLVSLLLFTSFSPDAGGLPLVARRWSLWLHSFSSLLLCLVFPLLLLGWLLLAGKTGVGYGGQLGGYLLFVALLPWVLGMHQGSAWAAFTSPPWQARSTLLPLLGGLLAFLALGFIASVFGDSGMAYTAPWLLLLGLLLFVPAGVVFLQQHPKAWLPWWKDQSQQKEESVSLGLQGLAGLLQSALHSHRHARAWFVLQGLLGFAVMASLLVLPAWFSHRWQQLPSQQGAEPQRYQQFYQQTHGFEPHLTQEKLLALEADIEALDALRQEASIPGSAQLPVAEAKANALLLQWYAHTPAAGATLLQLANNQDFIELSTPTIKERFLELTVALLEYPLYEAYQVQNDESYLPKTLPLLEVLEAQSDLAYQQEVAQRSFLLGLVAMVLAALFCCSFFRRWCASLSEGSSLGGKYFYGVALGGLLLSVGLLPFLPWLQGLLLEAVPSLSTGVLGLTSSKLFTLCLLGFGPLLAVCLQVLPFVMLPFTPPKKHRTLQNLLWAAFLIGGLFAVLLLSGLELSPLKASDASPLWELGFVEAFIALLLALPLWRRLKVHPHDAPL